MRLPNLLDHEDLHEVIEQSSAWNSLLNLHCHPDTKVGTIKLVLIFNQIPKNLICCKFFTNLIL